MKLELVTDYLFKRYVPKHEPLPFPKYLQPQNKWNNPFWITKEGECVFPYEMRDSHLLNIVRIIHRSNIRLESRYNSCNARKYIEYGFYIYEYSKKKGKIPRQVDQYCDLWTDYYLYMLLRREVKLRGLEEYI